VESVREFAQGRVWSGGDAVDRGLCDDLGGLADALDDAKRRAGLRPGDEIVVEEFPPRRLFTPPDLLGPLPGVLGLLRGSAGDLSAENESDAGYDIRYLRALAEAPGRPQLLLPPDHVPAGWADGR
jgi:ClpP class serine protease